MNFLFLRTLGMYMIYFKSLIKGDKLTLREIWNKREDYNLALYGALFWTAFLVVCFLTVAYCVENNIKIF
jgi:hypothetical protein